MHDEHVRIDLRLPDMNGVDVIRELQENLPEVPPVLLISADPPQSLKDAARSVGAAAVRKPFDFDELFEAIKRALAKQPNPGRSLKTLLSGFAIKGSPTPLEHHLVFSHFSC